MFEFDLDKMIGRPVQEISHPETAIFPMMTDKELQAMADDIKKNGLEEYIVVYRGKILDGRCRWIACQMAGVEPTVCEIDEEEEIDILEYLLSANLYRQHYSKAERAAAVAKAEEHYVQQAKHV